MSKYLKKKKVEKFSPWVEHYPKGVGKIIYEYAYYRAPFMEKLKSAIRPILKIQDRYERSIINLSFYKIIKAKYTWCLTSRAYYRRALRYGKEGPIISCHGCYEGYFDEDIVRMFRCWGCSYPDSPQWHPSASGDSD